MWVWVCNCVVCVWGVTCHNWAQFVSQPGAATAHSSVRTISHLLSPASAHSAVAATYFTPAPGLTRISVQWARCVLDSYIAQESRSSTLIAWHCATVSIKQDIVLNSDPHTNQPLIKLLLICVLLWQWGKNLMKGNLTLPWFYLSKCIQLTETQIVNTELQNMTGLDS